MPRTDNLYIIDSSSLIEIKRRYPRRTLPGIWNDLHALCLADQLIAPIEVKGEILFRDDELKRWTDDHDKIFQATDYAVIEKTREVLSIFPEMSDFNSQNNAQADPFLIGLALVHTDPAQHRLSKREVIVVSEETSDLEKNPKLPFSQIKKIPDACNHFKLKCINHLEMFKMEGFWFH
jgi:hypothetical protein